MANTTKRFVHVPVKSTFIAVSGWETTYEKSIIFFKDTQEIWTHGQFYAIPDEYKTKISDLETYIDSNIKTASWFNQVSVNGGTPLSTTVKGGVLNFTDSNNKFIEISATGQGISIDLKDELLATAEQGSKADSAVQSVNHTGSDYISAAKNGTAIEINSTELANKIAQIESDIEAATNGGVLKITGTTNTYVKVDKETGDVALNESGLVTKIQALEKADSDNLQEAKDYADGKIAGLNSDVTSTEGTKVRVQVVEAGGKITGVSVTESDIASAATLAAVKEDVDRFFNGALGDTDAEQVKDTLKEIQDYISSDAEAASAMTASIKAAKDAADAAQESANANADAITDLQDNAITSLEEAAPSTDNVTVIGKLDSGDPQGSVTIAGATKTKAGVMTAAHVVALTETIPSQITDLQDFALQDLEAVHNTNTVDIKGIQCYDNLDAPEGAFIVTTINAVTTTNAGVMTATDKVNLDNCVAHSAEWDWEEL